VEAFSKSFDTENLVVLGLEIWQADSQGIEDFIAATGITHTMLMNAQELMDDFGAMGQDYFVVIDAQGIIRFTLAGWNEETIRPYVEEALNDPNSVHQNSALFPADRFIVKNEREVTITIFTQGAGNTESSPPLRIRNMKGMLLKELLPVHVAGDRAEYRWHRNKADPEGVYILQLPDGTSTGLVF